MAKAIRIAMPDYEVIFRNDTDHVPYGNRTPEEILSFVLPVMNDLIEQGCSVIVVACNTVSTTLIEPLRRRFDVELIAVEPMVKPAAQYTRSGKIAVCATPATLASQRYAWLKQTYASKIQVIEPDCSKWSYMIEHNVMDEEALSQTINEIIAKGADVIVLGCTHYHWIETEINDLALGRARIIQPEPAVIRQLARVLERQQ